MTAYTLITGASEGLGADFARRAAKEGRALILTARSVDKLAALAEELTSQVPDVVVIPADLNDPAEVDRLWAEAKDGRDIDVLVNNAGLGYSGPFDAAEAWSREAASINVNVFALTRLAKLAVPHMKSAGKGRIINVASVAGFMPGPNFAVYHATKAYVLSFSQAIAEELRGTNVTVTALCPGPTQTNFFNDADMHDIKLLKLAKPARSVDVVDLGWLQARIGQRVIVPGAMNKMFAVLTRIMPASVVTRIASRVMGK